MNASREIGRYLTGLRTSNAAGKHKDKRTKRNRDRSAQKRNAINEETK